jgi:hypothetical protein
MTWAMTYPLPGFWKFGGGLSAEFVPECSFEKVHTSEFSDDRRELVNWPTTKDIRNILKQITSMS